MRRGAESVYSTVAALDGTLYFGSRDGNMYCVDAEAFQQAEWTTGLGAPITSSALTAGDSCIVGNDNFALYALSSADLSLDVLGSTNGMVCSSPAICYGVGPEERWLYVVSRAGGGTILAYRQQLSH